VTNAGAAFAVDSADYAVRLLVAVLRQVAAADAYIRGGRWSADGDFPLASKASTWKSVTIFVAQIYIIPI
jgi:hydroxypyruvate reductase 2